MQHEKIDCAAGKGLVEYVRDIGGAEPSLCTKILVDPLDKNNLSKAVECMQDGGVILLFTRVTYCFATNGLNAEGVGKIYQIKGRDSHKPLSLLCTGAQIERWAVVEGGAISLIGRFWPGNVSIILNKRKNSFGEPIIPAFTTSNLPTVRLACPDIVSCSICELADFPIAVTSANLSGQPPVVDPIEGIKQFGAEVDLLLLGPKSDVGTNTTIVDLTKRPPEIPRAGPVSIDELRKIIPDVVEKHR